MGLALRRDDSISNEEYLDGEQISEIRHEYIAGRVYAMSGATPLHNVISLNVVDLLRQHTAGKRCRVFASDVKVRVEASDAFFYPDVLVSCDPRDKLTERFVRYPSVVVEVLSPSTEAYDFGDKFDHYRNIPTLRDYVLIRQDRPAAYSFRRRDSGVWELRPLVEEDEIELESLGLRRPVTDLYLGIDFEEIARAAEEAEAAAAEAPPIQ